MTNAEKYLKDGVDDKDFLCDYIDFKNNSNLGFDINSLGLFLQAEVKPILTEDERVILRNVPSEKRYIGKHEGNFFLNDDLYISSEPNAGRWCRFPFDHLFKFIKTGEEYPIEELLK